MEDACLPGWQTGWPPTAAARKIKLDWSWVQAVEPGTQITVVLYKDQAPRGRRKVKGYFHSATDNSITLQPSVLSRKYMSKVVRP